MDLPLNWKGVVVVAIPLVVLTINWASLLYLTSAEVASGDAVSQAASVTRSAQDTLSALLDAETGVRGYLLTGQASFLQPYETAVHDLPPLLRSLRAQTRGKIGARAYVDVTKLTALAQQEMTTLGRLRGSAGASRASLQPALYLGKTTMDQVRQEIAILVGEEGVSVSAHDRALSAAEIGIVMVLILTVPLGVAGGVLAMVLFTRGVGRRIGAVRSNAESLPMGIQPASIPPAADEVGQLARAVHEVAGLLAQRAAEAAAATLAAQSANQAKTEFLSRMSHELRTPLNAILGFGQLLELEPRSADDQESVDQILKAGRHLLDLINEILDMARIEQGRLSLSMEPVEAHEIIQESLQLLGPIADRAGCELRFEPSATPRMVVADRQRLKQVMLNLLSNSLKYNRPGGSVVVDFVEGSSQRVGIRVSDTGIGISADLIPRLFSPFDRLGREGGSIGGTGLGLALSKSLVEAMNGTVAVTSVEGLGTQVTVELASVAAAGAGEPSSGPLQTQDAGRSGQPDGTMLYVEDNLSSLRLVERLLRGRPLVRLLPALQGQIGLDLAAEHAPKLILLDQHLPDLDGMEVLRRLRSHPATARSAIYLLTADASLGQRERFLAAGATGYLTKPVDVKELLGVLDQVLTATAAGPSV
ncbi:MAG: ATP-binding protein [Candidatus Dormibacteria bacterium]